MNDPSTPSGSDRPPAGVPPYPGRPPAVGPARPTPDGWADRSAPTPPDGPRRGLGYRLIMVAGTLAAVILAGGVGMLAFQEIRETVAVQQAPGGYPALPAANGTRGTDSADLAESLQHAHDGIAVDWAAGPDLNETGLDRGRTVSDAPGVLMVDTLLMNASGTGTGIVLTPDGLAITNYHVVEDSSEVIVTVADTGAAHTATVLGRDALHDVAVLRIEDAAGLDTVSIDTSVPRLGDLSAAVGNGSGRGYLTAVTGEVTSLGESIIASSGVPDEYARLTGLIETSADVVPGYSGGPLVDEDGQVVGITTAASQGASAQEVDGYAIPVVTALDVVAQVLSGQETDSVSIGVDGALGIQVATEDGAAVVMEVSPGSSAERLGLAVGDTVHSVDGQDVVSAGELSRIVNDQNVGDVVRVEWTTAEGERRSGEVPLQAAVVN